MASGNLTNPQSLIAGLLVPAFFLVVIAVNLSTWTVAIPPTGEHRLPGPDDRPWFVSIRTPVVIGVVTIKLGIALFAFCYFWLGNRSDTALPERIGVIGGAVLFVLGLIIACL